MLRAARLVKVAVRVPLLGEDGHAAEEERRHGAVSVRANLSLGHDARRRLPRERKGVDGRLDLPLVDRDEHVLRLGD